MTHTNKCRGGDAAVFVCFSYSMIDCRKDRGSMYNTKAWKRKRESILRRDKYRSQLAARYGRNVPGDTVHHILPVGLFPEYRWADWNLITITRAEHNSLHDRETNKLTEAGIELARRTAARRGLSMPEVMARLMDTEEQEE